MDSALPRPGSGRRLIRSAVVVAAAVAALLLGAVPALAMSAPSLLANASSNTTVGLQVFDHVNLSGALTPTGTLTFSLYEPGDTACQSPVFTSTVAVSGTGSDDSTRYTTRGGGVYQWVASYSGDANNSPVSSPCGQPQQSVVVAPAMPAVSLTAAFSNGALHGTATVAYGFASPTGTVTFNVTGPNDQFCQTTPVFTSTVAVNGDGSYDSGRFTPTTPGTYTYRIRYSGDTNNYGVGPTSCLDQAASVTVTQDQLQPAAAAFTSPTNGGALNATSPITWSAAAGAQRYILQIGTSSGGGDLLSVDLGGGTQSYNPPLLPSGRTLYGRIWTMTGGAWSSHQDITFSAAEGATFTSPVNGQGGVTPGPLTWTAVDRAQHYAIWLGTTAAGYDLASIQLPAGTTSWDPGALPAGHRIHARVWTMVAGVWTRYQDITFTPGMGAMFTSPSNGQTGVGTGSSLSWSPVSGAQYYAVGVGTSPGSFDLASAGVPAGGATTWQPSGLPSGRTLYARVWTMVSGAWVRYHDIAFVTA